MPVCLPYASRADVREQATSGSAKPRRRRVRLDAGAASQGLGVEPQQASGDIQKDIATHCLPQLNEPANAGVLQKSQPSCTLEERCIYRQKGTGS